MKRGIYLGYDPRPAEVQAFSVARHSIWKRTQIDIIPVKLDVMRRINLYTRPTETRDGKMWDTISGAPMSTEFAISRFLVPFLAKKGLALFADGDVMARADLNELFKQADPSKACMVVKHQYTSEHATKMDGQVNLPYPRKNWSSVVLWNCNHKRARYLTPEVVNRERGLWLHQFSWLDDGEIGELDPGWNHLVGEQPPNPNAKLVHFTLGTPNMPGKADCEHAAEWRRELSELAA